MVILQVVVAGGEFIRDDVAFIGPVTLRHVGYVVTAALSLAIGVAIIRDLGRAPSSSGSWRR